MHFAPELGLWSPLIFWYCFANTLLSLGFTFVVIVGGSRDLRFLLRALKEEATAADKTAGEEENILNHGLSYRSNSIRHATGHEPADSIQRKP